LNIAFLLKEAETVCGLFVGRCWLVTPLSGQGVFESNLANSLVELPLTYLTIYS